MTIFARLAEDPRAVVLEVLRAAGTPLRAGEIKARLVELGAGRAEVARAWDRAQRSVRFSESVVFERNAYLYKESAVNEARERQARVDAATRLAEVAAEVEELCAAGARPQTLVERVRLRVAREGLVPLGSAGASVPFDRAQHRAIGGGVRDGAPVAVVRPGYAWTGPDGTIVVAKAIVEE